MSRAGKTHKIYRDVQVHGLYVSDMIAHNNDRERNVFQMAPGEARRRPGSR